jgi:restriction system protein
MSLPDFQTFMRPLLVTLEDGQERTSRDIRATLSNQFSLTPKDLAERNPRGRNRYTNLVAWALHHLSRACLVERRGPSVYRITSRGSEALVKHPARIHIGVCAEFEEWHHSRARRSTRQGTANRQAADRSAAAQKAWATRRANGWQHPAKMRSLSARSPSRPASPEA